MPRLSIPYLNYTVYQMFCQSATVFFRPDRKTARRAEKAVLRAPPPAAKQRRGPGQSVIPAEKT